MIANRRGVYLNEERGKQLICFDGLRYGNITPTDFDGVIEYHNYLWIVYEAKLEGAHVPHGQKLALERYVQTASLAKKNAIALVAEHNIHNPKDKVILMNCKVREYFSTADLKWKTPKHEITVKELSDWYISYYDRISEEIAYLYSNYNEYIEEGCEINV